MCELARKNQVPHYIPEYPCYLVIAIFGSKRMMTQVSMSLWDVSTEQKSAS